MKVMKSILIVLIMVSFVWIVPGYGWSAGTSSSASESSFWDEAEKIYKGNLELIERVSVNESVLKYNEFSESIGKEISLFDKNFCNVPHGDKFLFCRKLLRIESIRENLSISKKSYESNPTEDGILKTKKLTSDAKNILRELDEILIRNKDAPKIIRRY